LVSVPSLKLHAVNNLIP